MHFARITGVELIQATNRFDQFAAAEYDKSLRCGLTGDPFAKRFGKLTLQ
jgi:hypothetical protein